MTHRVYFRIFGYVVTIVMHTINLLAMFINLRVQTAHLTEDSLNYKAIMTFTNLQLRFMTTWNVFLQLGHAILGLYTDILVLNKINTKNHKLATLTNVVRDLLFASVVWPGTWVVCIVFWTAFNYDRDLVFPIFLDQLLTRPSNHIVHTAIIPVVLWEILFRPRKAPDSHTSRLVLLFTHMFIYVFVLHYSYFEQGVWLYPMFDLGYLSMKFILLHAVIAILWISAYYFQWFLNFIIHQSTEKTNAKAY